MLAKTMATAFKKGNEGCFTCEDKNHLKGDCPNFATPRTTWYMEFSWTEYWSG